MRLGIVGGGQLGQMLTQAAVPLGFDVTVLDPQDRCPAARAGATQIVGSLTSADCLADLAARCDVLTWEVEHIGAQALIELERHGTIIHPSPASLLRIQDKLVQKTDQRAAGLAVGDFYSVDEFVALSEDEAGAQRFIAKRRRGGFDGRGNSSPGSHAEVVDEIAHSDPDDIYVELVLPFDHEIAVIAARDRAGNIETYAPVETHQADGICVSVEAPAQLDGQLLDDARQLGIDVISIYEGAGVFAIEMFVVGSRLLINEVAPRVHNSGHFSIEGTATSQFENHVRAVVGYPLGDVTTTRPAVMMNLLGPTDGPLNPTGVAKALDEPGTHIHLYGKEWRPGRKIGHLTTVADTMDVARQRAQQAWGYFQP
jgi:5-(carboxyamino)imidazole ribonucleotide synthase